MADAQPNDTGEVTIAQAEEKNRSSGAVRNSDPKPGIVSSPNKKRKRAPSNGRPLPSSKTTKMQCPVCNGLYSNRDNVKRHIRQTHPQISEKQILEWVPPMINRDMNNYSFVFKCRVCDDSFAYKHNLKRHMMSIHKISEAQATLFCNSIKDKDGNTPGSKPRKLDGPGGMRSRHTRASHEDNKKEERDLNPLDYDTRDYIGKLRKNVSTV